MTHVWTVKQDGKDIGTVEAVSRKGACHTAYEAFGIEHSKRGTISVDLLHRDHIRHRSGIVTGPAPDIFGDVACSFNPALAREADEKTVETCRQRFETGPFQGFPKRAE